MMNDETTQSKLAAQVDGEKILAEIGGDAEEIEWRKDFTRLTEADKERLAEMRPLFEDIAEDLVGDFYEHLLEYDETLAIIDRSTRTVEQLRQTQAQYLVGLGRGTYDMNYFAQRARIGKIHDLLDLGPKIYLGAYTIYYQGLIGAITRDAKREFEIEPDSDAAAMLTHVVDRILSVLKLISVDQQVAMDTYIHSYSQDIQEELERRKHESEHIEQSMAEFRAAADIVTESASGISELADEQSENSRQVAGEVANLSATIEEVAASAGQVENTSRNAQQLAEEGQDAAQNAIDVMADVDDAHQDVGEDVDDLQETVADIDAVVEVINGIADQTNLLALNASIEAARAGDAGTGFAVVADEIKSLAEESKARATDIEEMIDDVQTNTANTVDSLDTTGELLEAGVADVQRSMETLQGIVAAVDETGQGIEEVSNATDDQAASAEEVAAMVDEAAAQADEIATEIEQIATAVDQQNEQVDEVDAAITRLNDVQ